jgi:mevalonate kinase
MGGHSLQAAIDLGVTVIAECRWSPDREGLVSISSDWPVGESRSIDVGDLADRIGGHLDFPQQAVACLAERFGSFTGSLELHSTLPMAAGLASSAASIIASIAAVANELELGLSRTEICELAFVTESTRLETGAGRMDFGVCGFGGTRLVRFDQEAELEMTEFPDFGVAIVIGDSGTRALTSQSIRSKRERFMRRDPEIVEYQRRTDQLVVEMGHCLERQSGVAELGARMNACQEALSSLMRSSTPMLDSMIAAARGAGSLGAKLSGGGSGGCMFALLDGNSDPQIAESLGAKAASVRGTTISARGLAVEEIDEVG